MPYEISKLIVSTNDAVKVKRNGVCFGVIVRYLHEDGHRFRGIIFNNPTNEIYQVGNGIVFYDYEIVDIYI